MTRTTPNLAPPSPNFHATPTGGRLTTTCDLTCNRPADLQWNRVSNMEPSGPTAETLPLGHHVLKTSRNVQLLCDLGSVDLHSPSCSGLEPDHYCLGIARGLFWYPRLGWVPHVNNGTQPNRGYQNRPPRVMNDQKVPRSMEQRIVIKFLLWRKCPVV
ncbi:hypothetical protein AVEN_62394-1 [Araneus ventricosus]|uniref:Uncharacterized protein n=1 Tax=Araneus ventricosus TaxID=182803 RepID=A0A4Y2W151_ARAVE|nr:hypothetical protein AVEN_62394-1 [Araneus ventricosus]